ncbi:MAG: 4-vinyl reductase [Chloroflexi bacterium]|nr:MAG: 4-vinyl reductase [Chloroflexota bacterium]
MVAITPSGLYYPNKMARIYILAIEQTLGPEAMKAVFQAAGVPLKFYPPPNNFAKEFDFAYYGAIGDALEKMYGQRGVRGLTLHAGRVSFSGGLAEFGAMIGISELSFKAIPLQAKLKVGLRGIAETYRKFSDLHAEVTEEDDHFLYTIRQCPVCWGRTAARPICFGMVGILQAGLHWLSSGREFDVQEIACRAAGDEACVFRIPKTPLPVD